MKRLLMLMAVGLFVPLVMAQDAASPQLKTDQGLMLDGLKHPNARRAAQVYMQTIDRATVVFNKSAEGARKVLITSLEQAAKAAQQNGEKDDAKAITEVVARMKVGQYPVVPGGAGPIGAVPFKDKWYRIVLGNFSWSEAKSDAEALGGRLVCIANEEELGFCTKLTGHAVRVWVGASDERKEGDWRWLDGTAVNKALWAGGEPNNAMGVENWAEMRHSGKLNDTFKGDKSDGYIMEFPRGAGM